MFLAFFYDLRQLNVSFTSLALFCYGETTSLTTIKFYWRFLFVFPLSGSYNALTTFFVNVVITLRTTILRLKQLSLKILSGGRHAYTTNHENILCLASMLQLTSTFLDEYYNNYTISGIEVSNKLICWLSFSVYNIFSSSPTGSSVSWPIFIIGATFSSVLSRPVDRGLLVCHASGWY